MKSGVKGRVWDYGWTLLSDSLRPGTEVGVVTCLAARSSEAASALPVCWTIW